MLSLISHKETIHITAYQALPVLNYAFEIIVCDSSRPEVSVKKKWRVKTRFMGLVQRG